MLLALILSMMAVLAAPLLARLTDGRPAYRAGLDGFVIVVVFGLIFLTLLPEALAHGGLAAFLVAALGFALPWLAELMLHHAEAKAHRAFLAIAFIAILLHEASDGAILALAAGHEGAAFVATGIVVHRIGVAVALWWLFRPFLSQRSGYLMLATLAAVSGLGYGAATIALDWHAIPIVGYWQAFAAGSLLHIVLHPLEEDPATERETRRGQQAGTLAGVLLLMAFALSHMMHSGHDHVAGVESHANAIDLMATTGHTLAPLLLGLVLSGIAFGYVRHRHKRLEGCRDGLDLAAPWSLLLWLAVTVIALLRPGWFPEPPAGTVRIDFTLILWSILTLASFLRMGARRFVGTLMPRTPFARLHAHHTVGHHHHHGHGHGKDHSHHSHERQS